MLRTKTYFFMHTSPVKHFTVCEVSTQGSYLMNSTVPERYAVSTCLFNCLAIDMG